MRIKIIGKERLIAFNGQDGVPCAKGSIHDVSDDLGASLVRDKWATEIAAPPTFEEYVAAGYTPDSYPPRGYDEVPSPGLTAFREQQADDARIAQQATDEARIAAEDAARVAALPVGPSDTKATGPSENK